MNSEKEIVMRWLNKKGFFTVTGIPAGKREIDIIAKRGSQIWHVEILSSITSADNVPMPEIRQRFESKQVESTILKMLGQNYTKVLVVGKTSNLDRYKKIEGVQAYNLSEVLYEFISEIGTHNYKDSATRTAQLIKFLLISEPKMLAKLLEKEKKILNLNTRETFLKELMAQHETKRILSKRSFEPELVKIIKNSTLNRPEKLADVIEQRVLNSRTRKKFIETLMKSQGIKREIKQTMKKDQKTLDFFSG